MGDFLDQFERIPLAQKLLLLIALLAGVGVAFYFIVYTDQQESIANAQRQVSQLNNRQAELRAQIDDIDRVRDEVTQLCRRQQAFMERLPSEPGIGSIIRMVEQQAELAGLRLTNQTLEAERRRSNYTEIPLRLDIEGTWDELTNFFYFLGRQPRIVNVRDIQLSQRGGALRDGRSPILRATCNVSTYYAGADQGLGGESCDI